MNAQTTHHSFIDRPSAFGWLAAATVALLLVPLIAMQFSTQVNWTALDFAVMGALAFGMGSAFIVLARVLPRKHRVWVALGCAVVFVCLWAELAVGVFTQLGS